MSLAVLYVSRPFLYLTSFINLSLVLLNMFVANSVLMADVLYTDNFPADILLPADILESMFVSGKNRNPLSKDYDALCCVRRGSSTYITYLSILVDG